MNAGNRAESESDLENSKEWHMGEKALKCPKAALDISVKAEIWRDTGEMYLEGSQVDYQSPT